MGTSSDKMEHLFSLQGSCQAWNRAQEGKTIQQLQSVMSGSQVGVGG
jgi:hypothetical protein